jgi:hypothetical protein
MQPAPLLKSPHKFQSSNRDFFSQADCYRLHAAFRAAVQCAAKNPRDALFILIPTQEMRLIMQRAFFPQKRRNEKRQTPIQSVISGLIRCASRPRGGNVRFGK